MKERFRPAPLRATRISTDEFLGFIGEMGLPKDPSRYGAMRKALQAAANADEEAALKAARNYGGSGYAPPPSAPANRRHQHFGSVIVSCERADLRPVADGVMIYWTRPSR